MLRNTFLHFSYFFFPKVQKGNEIWTFLKMSKIKCRKNSWKLVFLHFLEQKVTNGDFGTIKLGKKLVSRQILVPLHFYVLHIQSQFVCHCCIGINGRNKLGLVRIIPLTNLSPVKHPK